jgi:hypothetical protein
MGNEHTPPCARLVGYFFAYQDGGQLRFYRFGKSHPWRKRTVAAARFCLSGNSVLLSAKGKPALRIEEGRRIRRMAEGSRQE